MVSIKGMLATLVGSALLLVLPASSHHATPENTKLEQVSAERDAAAGAKADALEMFGKSPMRFEANRGQADARVKFISRGAGYVLFLTRDGAVMALQNATPVRPVQGATAEAASSMAYVGSHQPAARSPQVRREAVLSMRVVGANAAAKIAASWQLPNTSNYFSGNDPAKWRTNVPNFEKVRYSGIYPGIDLVYYGSQRQLEYDFVVAPGADPNQLALRLDGAPDGADKISSGIDHNGDLLAHLEGGDVRFHKPVVYQSDGQQIMLVDRPYVLRSNGEVGLQLG